MKKSDGKRMRKIMAETVFDIVEIIINSGNRDDFISECKRQGFKLRISPTDARIVKKYLRDKQGITMQAADGEFERCT